MTTPQAQPTASRRSTAKQSTIGGLILAGVVAAYAFGQPILNQQMGWNLPALTPRQAPDTVAETTSKGSPATEPNQPTVAEKPLDQGKAKSGPLTGHMPKLDDAQLSPDSKSPATKVPPAKVAAADQSLLYGLLKDLGGERYQSPAGLLYTRGGAEGHRLDHLERHTQDDPSRPGKHGVFDGGMEGALKTIDRAYERAKTGQKTTKELDQGRTVYTVDLGSRVGYIGGRDGNRQHQPMARRVRIVLDENRVITAFPL